MRTPTDMPRRWPHTSRRMRIGILVGVIVLILLIVSVNGLARFWTDYLWFDSVGFNSVFRGVLLTKLLLALVFIAIFFLLMYVNLLIADRVAPEDLVVGEVDELVVRYREVVAPHARAVRIVTSLVFALLAGVGANREWNNWDLLRYSVPFGVSDPEYHRDVGFYVFELPFIKFLTGWFFEAMIVVLIVTIVAHYLNGGIHFQSAPRRIDSAVKTHLSVLLGVLAIIKAIDYYFQRLELVLSKGHVVQGATATVVHADKPAKTLLIAIAIIAAGLFLYNIRQKGWILPAVAVALWGVIYVLVGAVYPALYQAVRVNPSELTREAPYINNNIQATLAAYNLKNVQVESKYTYSPTVSTSQIDPGPGETATDLAEQQVNQQTLANVRLLDPSVPGLLNTVTQYQKVRNYYTFNDLDPDRYTINGRETATVASVRELDSSALPSGFVNQHLVYTHGYGAVVAPIGQAGVDSNNGQPNFDLENLPPTTNSSALQLKAPGSEIYYGENMGGYVIANTKTPELDYENSVGSNITTHYTGSGGVAAGGLFRRLAFAIRFGDPNFVLSGQINSSSRVIFTRDITSMVQKAAPFLKYDADPYAVVLNNQVYWVVDAYTTTDNYPYSQDANTDRVPASSGLDSTFNYVRNSVKVVINAYTGKMDFVVVDPSDPIIQVYERAFPDLFMSESKANTLIPGIVAHFRYPEDLFRVQTNMYGRYHLTNASDFYTQGQAWVVSPDPGSGPLSQTAVGESLLNTANSSNPFAIPTVARLQPEYILAAQPGQTQLSFMLLTPFVPVSSTVGSPNMTAFMTASSDPGDYGQLRVYETPPGEVVQGPTLVANAIRTNAAISYELTYYNQQGSTVELGEVSVIPIANTLLYIEPIYVESSASQIPLLKDVVVVYNGVAYHSNNASLDNALCQIDPSGGPFSSYCNTTAAKGTQNVVPTPSGTGTAPGSGSRSTTTIPPSSSPSTAPPSNATISSLLTLAQNEFNQANAALRAGNLGTYQSDNAAAEAYVAEAARLAANGKR